MVVSSTIIRSPRHRTISASQRAPPSMLRVIIGSPFKDPVWRMVRLCRPMQAALNGLAVFLKILASSADGFVQRDVTLGQLRLRGHAIALRSEERALRVEHVDERRQAAGIA